MRFLFLLAVLVTVFTAIYGYSEEEAWNDFKPFFVAVNQEKMRRALFHIRNSEVVKHNSENPGTFRLELNNFSDMAPIELDRYLGIKSDSAPSERFLETIEADAESRQMPPASLDYRYDLCLPAVKNQGSCGSCWAFTAITPLEFSKCRKSGSGAVVLSEQQLVDCDRSNGGCNGGWYTNAWDYIMSAGGCAKKSFYSNVASVGTCRYTSRMVGARISSHSYVQSLNPTAMQVALQKYGPLAVAMTVDSSFYSYASGVYSNPNCDNKTVNHGVVIVGWGVLNGMKYWIGRNSWGTGWGLSGYFFILRGVNKCNIEKYPAYVIAY